TLHKRHQIRRSLRSAPESSCTSPRSRTCNPPPSVLCRLTRASALFLRLSYRQSHCLSSGLEKHGRLRIASRRRPAPQSSCLCSLSSLDASLLFCSSLTCPFGRSMGRTVPDSRNLSWLGATVNSRINPISESTPRKPRGLFFLYRPLRAGP